MHATWPKIDACIEDGSDTVGEYDGDDRWSGWWSSVMVYRQNWLEWSLLSSYCQCWGSQRVRWIFPACDKPSTLSRRMATSNATSFSWCWTSIGSFWSFSFRPEPSSHGEDRREWRCSTQSVQNEHWIHDQWVWPTIWRGWVVDKLATLSMCIWIPWNFYWVCTCMRPQNCQIAVK